MTDWFSEELAAAKARKDLVPPHARSVLCCPGLARADLEAECYCPPANIGDGIKPQPDCLRHGVGR